MPGKGVRAGHTPHVAAVMDRQKPKSMKIKELINVPEGKYPVKQMVRWLWAMWRGNRLQAMLNASLGIGDVALSLLAVWAVQRAVDIAARSRDGSLIGAVAVMGGITLCGFGVRIARIWVRNILGIRAQNRMQQRMLDRILRSEWNGRERMHSGDVINRLGFDVGYVVTFLTETIPGTLSVLTLFIGAFVYLFSMDHTLALITVAMLPVFILLSKAYMVRMRRLSRLVRDSDSKVQSVLQETIQHRVLVKTLEQDDEMVDRLEHTHSELRQNVVNRTKFSVFSNFVMNFGFAAGYLVAFLWSALRMYGGTLTFGGMTAFLQLVGRIQSPARSLTRLVPAFVTVLTAAERLMELEEDPVEEQGKPIYLDDKNGVGVRMDNVIFGYADADGKVLNGMSFDFRPGTCTAIIGETGSGKTTVVRLLLALLHPQDGTIKIYNSHSSHELSPLTRCNFVYVPQGNTLLSGTIRDNLRLGRLDATDSDMTDALHKACADFVNELPGGLDAVCAEAGGGLSEGQAQRIAIARALLRPGSIMLLDEATSALDPETEKQLLQNILADSGKTVIFVTHRHAVLDYCDAVMHL